MARAKKPAAKASKNSKRTTRAGSIDIAALLAEVKQRIADPASDYTIWEPLVEQMKPAKAAVASAAPELQRAFWLQYYEVTSSADIREVPEAVRALIALEKDAPASERALRLANLATAECTLKNTAGYDTLQKALKLAPDDDTRAKILIEWVDVTADQVTPGVALLDAYALANAGKLSKALASSVWERAAHAWPLATSAKSRKAQEKLLASRGIASSHDLAFDACKRWLAANPQPTERTLAVVSTLCEHLCSRDQVDEACRLFDKWTPVLVEQCKAGKVDSHELSESWFGSHARNLEGSNRKGDAKKIRKLAEKYADL